MKFTKHFYIEGQRIVSKLGDMGKNQDLLNPKDTIKAGNNGNHPIDWDNKHENLKDQIIENFEELGLTGAVFTAGKSGKIPYGQIKKYYRNSNGIIDGYGSDSTSARNYDGNKAELLQFYYHPDHLGSSNFISDVSGEVYQHMEYFPFGETFIEERNGTDYTNYLYNGKELDEETGLYYYGARYYDPRISMFYGVDPMAEKYPAWSPYVYTYDNPIRYNDPTGMEGEDPNAWQRFKESAKFTFSEIGKLAKNSGLGKAVSAVASAVVGVDASLKGDNTYETKGGLQGSSENGGGEENHSATNPDDGLVNIDALLGAANAKTKSKTRPTNASSAENIANAISSAVKAVDEAKGSGNTSTTNGQNTTDNTGKTKFVGYKIRVWNQYGTNNSIIDRTVDSTRIYEGLGNDTIFRQAFDSLFIITKNK